ncbi:ergosterol biosynthesis ERG4/ERG24 family protein [Fusarium oxysporum f. sp. phaseoli]
MKAPKTPEYEFGGPIGATGIVFGLPILMQLLYLGCNDVSGCPAPALLEPKTLTWQKFKEQTPWPKEGIWGFMSWEVTGWLLAYYFLSLVLYRVLPAQEVYGTKLRESGKALRYRFNSFSSSVVQLVACAVGTYIHGAEFPVWTFMTTNYLQLLTTSTVLTFIVSLYVYIGSFSVKKGNPELRELARGGHTGRIIYDFFIGRELNPRVTLPIFGEIDIKSWLEMRTALTGWILFNCAFIAQQYRNYGYVSDSILVIATVQAYYVLEGQYSELGLLGMMDITQDGLGFMLTWGNMVWVPFLYSTQCRYLSVYPVHLGPVGVSAIATVFAIGLYIFRSSNNQKALFRKDPNHPAFANMTFIQTKRGTKLLTGGWWGMARHINYFGDWLQSLPFSLPTKFAGYVILPAGSAVAGNEVVKMLDGRLVTPDGAAPWGMLFTYFYSAWFGFLLIHRERRDDAACIEKYGKDWDEYKNKVRYRILPGFKGSFQAGDLEPGYNAKYNLLQEILRAMLKTPHVGSTDWIFFIAEILEWLDLSGDYDDYVQDPRYPWPHSFIVQDIVQAFAMIAMFFPDSNVTTLVTMFVNSSQCDEFRKSGVFDPKERSKVRPDRRTRPSYKFRDKELWKEWKEFYTRVTDYICFALTLTDAHYNEGLLDCPNGYGDVGCPFGTAAHDVQQHPPVNDGDQCVTTYTCCR